MEGIYDGGAADTCFECELLYPERSRPCPRCGSRMRYRPAVMMDEPSLSQAIIAGLRRRDDRDGLVGLLELVHRFQPRSVELLASAGYSIDELRRAWEAL